MDEAKVLDQLIAAGLALPGESWTVVRSHGGLNTRVYRAIRSDGGSELSIRMFSVPGMLEREVAAIAEVAHCPGVPRVRFAGNGTLVHDYLPGRPRPLPDVEPEAIRRLCECLQCIHGVEHDHYTLWPAGEVRHGTRRDLFRERCSSLSFAHAAAPAATRARIAAIRAWLDSQPLDAGSWRESRFSRLHGDLSFGNILWADGAVGLIDWEFTRIGDPAEELAYLITEQPVGGEGLDLIRDSYIAAGGDAGAWERVHPYAVFAAVDSAVWWVEYLHRSGQDPSGHPEVDKRLDVAEQWIDKAGAASA